MRRFIPAALPIICCGLFLPALSGCGLILGGGTRQSVLIQSTPSATKVSTTPVTMEYTTPSTLNLERKTNYTLKFEKEGYSPATLALESHVRAGIVIADVLLAGLIGVVVDATTGAWSKLVPEAVTVSLTKIAAVPGPGTITVGIRLTETRAANLVEVQSSTPGVLMHVAPRPVH
jgi:hypothetical protein